MHIFGQLVHIFGELAQIFGELVHIFARKLVSRTPRNKFRIIGSHYGNRGFTMILMYEPKITPPDFVYACNVFLGGEVYQLYAAMGSPCAHSCVA